MPDCEALDQLPDAGVVVVDENAPLNSDSRLMNVNATLKNPPLAERLPSDVNVLSPLMGGCEVACPVGNAATRPTVSPPEKMKFLPSTRLGPT